MATWYAQLAATDVSAANQWNAAPDGSGAWLTWANLGAADVLCANGKTNLTIAAGFTCGSITTSGGGIGANGGGFIVASGVTPTATCNVVAGTTTCLSVAAGRTITITGDVTGGSATNAYGVYANGGTITITGAVTGGSAYGAYGAFAQNAGAITITGAVTGGSAATAFGAYAATAGTITINGTVTAGATWSAYGAFCNDASGSLTIVGSIINSNTGGPGVAGLYYWQPASVAHYWQVAWNGSLDQRYTEAPGEESVRYGLQFGYNGVTLMTGSMVVPAVTDVRAGVGYDDEAKTLGTLALPAEADVKTGVGYGGDGTEYTGTLVAGGGGVPLIGPGGLVG